SYKPKSNQNQINSPNLVSFHHRFPKSNSTNYTQWIHCCKRQDKFNPQTSYICLAHFTDAEYKRDLEHEVLNLPPRRRLEPGCISTVFLNRTTINEVAASATDKIRTLKAIGLRKLLVSNL